MKSYSIAFIGTDGSGKSTVIKNIIPKLKLKYSTNVFYEHMRPNMIPSIANLFGKKTIKNEIVTDPHSKKPSGLVGSLLRWCYYLIDYSFGYFLKVYLTNLTKPCIWIFDRYYYDYLIDKKRTRVNLPNWLIRFGQLIIPEPDLIVSLGTNPSVIYNRKPETSLNEVSRQIYKLKSFTNTHKNAVWLDTGQSIETTINQAMFEIEKLINHNFKSIN